VRDHGRILRATLHGARGAPSLEHAVVWWVIIIATAMDQDAWRL
tara:strand:+ start:127 stop:258 length:132 start_codon:yes stop_codon:yes gene_type:complete